MKAWVLRENRAIEARRLKPPMDIVFPFAATVEAFRHLESGAAVGKVTIRLWRGTAA